jgi:hypothetical protein
MRLDVVGDHSDLRDAVRLTHPAQWLDPKLMTPNATPPFKLVPPSRW